MIASSHRRSTAKRAGRTLARLEVLEGRRLLSGNVTLTTDPETWVTSVIGDNKSNEIQIAVDLDIYTFFITGLNGTTINGSTEPLQPMWGQPRISMGNGDDIVRMISQPVEWGNTATSDGTASIDTGNGNDQVILDGYTFQNMFITTGAGNDRVTISNVIWMDLLSIDTGNGKDTVTFVQKNWGQESHNTIIDGGNGRDSVIDLGNLTVTNNGVIDLRDVELVTY